MVTHLTIFPRLEGDIRTLCGLSGRQSDAIPLQSYVMEEGAFGDICLDCKAQYDADLKSRIEKAIRQSPRSS